MYNNPLKFTSNEEQKVFFTSDCHFNHEMVLIDRGSITIEEQTEKQIIAWNSVVTDKDIVFSLGDFCLRDGKGEFTQNILKRLNFKYIYFIYGNHPSGVKQMFKDKSYYNIDTNINHPKICYELGQYAELFVNKQPIVLFHYPISVWNYMRESSWALVGHSHNNFKQSQKESTNGKILDVGIDGSQRPLEFHEIKEIMSRKLIEKLDHHV